MDYEGQICRTPREKASYMLPISVGCPYNKCKFCGLFKHLDYRVLPLEQIKADIDRIELLRQTPKSVMLGDGNAFGVRTDRILEVLTYLHKKLPNCGDISADATISCIALKSDDELRQLAEAGIKTLYIGIESGLDDVLEFMNKEHSNAEAIKQIERIYAAGMNYGAHIMTGVAGAGRGIENARATAAFINQTKPSYICNFSMFIHRDLELGKEVEQGDFKPASEQENLVEERELIQQINYPVDFDGFTDAVELRVLGHLPEDRERMLTRIDRCLDELKDSEPIYSLVGRPA